MDHPEAQPSSDKRILVVGEGPLTAAIVKELIRRGYNAHEATEDEIAAAKQDAPLLPISRDLETIELHGSLVEPVVPLLARELEDHSPPHDWYLRFTGRRGRPPRY